MLGAVFICCLKKKEAIATCVVQGSSFFSSWGEEGWCAGQDLNTVLREEDQNSLENWFILNAVI